MTVIDTTKVFRHGRHGKGNIPRRKQMWTFTSMEMNWIMLIWNANFRITFSHLVSNVTGNNTEDKESHVKPLDVTGLLTILWEYNNSFIQTLGRKHKLPRYYDSRNGFVYSVPGLYFTGPWVVNTSAHCLSTSKFTQCDAIWCSALHYTVER